MVLLTIGSGKKLLKQLQRKCSLYHVHINVRHVISVEEIASEKGKVRCCMWCQECAWYSSTSGSLEIHWPWHMANKLSCLFRSCHLWFVTTNTFCRERSVRLEEKEHGTYLCSWHQGQTCWVTDPLGHDVSWHCMAPP